MAEKVYTGRDGSLIIRTAAGDDTLAKVQNWSIDAQVEMLETTSLAENSRTYVPGLKSYSGSCTLLYYQDAVNTRASVRLLDRIIRTGGVQPTDTLTLVLRFFDNTTNANRDIEFTCYINSAQLGASVGEISTAQISFTVNGDITSQTL
jgi:hypothetical protein